MTTDWFLQPTKTYDRDHIETARQRQDQLTKPPGSLGALETVAVRLCGLLGPSPQLEHVSITVFAADHGVAVEGVSAFPQVVTGEMVRNFSCGGAAISVLARYLKATLEVVNLGTVNDPGVIPGVVDAKINPQTGNLARGAAMTDEQLRSALMAGHDAISRVAQRNASLFIGGDMGIGNTTSATALGCAYLKLAASELVGPGTGLDSRGIARKTAIIDQALRLHQAEFEDPLGILRCLGGFEIAGLAGAYIASAQAGIPILIDGFISTAAALAAVKINPGTLHWMLLSHTSAEPGHRRLVDALGLRPLIDLQMRLGEGSGAAVTVPLLEMACRLHNEMATFDEAGVSEA